MSRKRGLTLEEKRVKVLEIFHEKKDVFQLKDIERIASKEKGIPSQTVKDVLMSLVADDMVDTDKIGSSVYFWAFPSKAFAAKVKKLDELEKSVREAREKKAALSSEIETLLQNSKENSEEAKRRIEIQDELNELSKKKAEYDAIIAKFKDCDPDNLSKMEEDLEVAKAAVERWTDNVFTIQSYLKNKFQMAQSDIQKSFGIPEDFDYYEEPA